MVVQYSQRGVHGHVVNDIGSRIVSGHLPGGSTIDPAELTTRYDVSRTVVREALKVLSGKGLVDARPKRGTFVRDRENWNLLDPDVLHWQSAVTDNPDILEKLHEVRVMVEAVRRHDPSAARAAMVEPLEAAALDVREVNKVAAQGPTS